MRRYDVMGRFFFPLKLGFRSPFLRWALRREMPRPEYWSLNDRGYAARPAEADRAGSENNAP